MEKPHSDAWSNPRGWRLNTSTGDNFSPLNPKKPSFIGRGFLPHQLQLPRTPILDSYASPDSYSNPPHTPLSRQLHSSSGSYDRTSVFHSGRGAVSPLPMSPFQNVSTPPPSRLLAMFTTPVKIEEGVVVMDGILVDCSSSRTRPMLTPTESGGSLQLSSSARNVSSLRREDFAACRSASNFQFARGKEELRPSRHSSKNKEATPCRYYSSRTCPYGSSCRFLHDVKVAIPSMEASPPSSKLPSTPTTTVTPSQLGSGAGPEYSSTSTAAASNDWSPIDDGIMASLPSASSEETPSKEDVDARILKFLYGRSAKKRLPAFTEFAP